MVTDRDAADLHDGRMIARRSILILCSSALALFSCASVAQGTVRVLETYKAEIDVKMSASERSIWNGIAPGCFAPQESFDTKLTARIDSTPSSKSQIKPGTVTLFPGSYGMTSSYGDKGSFVQAPKSGAWELQTQNPAGCNAAAGAVPSWATSPTCKKTSERVMASLIQHSVDDGPSGSTATDGSIIIMRTPKASPRGTAKSIGASCVRTLHNIDPSQLDSQLDFGLKSTFIQIPIPGLRTKLEKLTKGGAKSRPSFKVPIDIGGDCKSMTMKPSIGGLPGFEPSNVSFPHQALGNIFGDFTKSVCMADGDGRVTVRRVGRVVETTVPG